MTVSLRNLGELFVTLGVGCVMVFFAHQGLEAEYALGRDRSVPMMAGYAMLGLTGLLVAPSIRALILPAWRAVYVIVRTGRRSTDVAAVAVQVPPTEKP